MRHADQIFDTNIIAYCQQNWYVRLATYTDLFILTLIWVGVGNSIPHVGFPLITQKR